MTDRAVAAVAVIAFVVWLGLALIVAIAICRTIQEAERRRPRPSLRLVEPLASVDGRVHLEVYGEWLEEGDPSAIRPSAVPPRLDVRL